MTLSDKIEQKQGEIMSVMQTLNAHFHASLTDEKSIYIFCCYFPSFYEKEKKAAKKDNIHALSIARIH